MNILIVGNFSGKNAENRAAESASSNRNMLNIDPLNLEAAMRKLQPVVSLGEDDNPLTVNISTMDDFHPDRLFASQPAFTIITELKQSLRDPNKAASAALICKQLLGQDDASAPEAAPAPPTSQQSAPNDDSDDMFTRLLGDSVSRPETGNRKAKQAVQKILGDAVAGDTVTAQAPEIQSIQDDLDEWCANSMRDLLRSPDFRQLEMAWRSLQWLGEHVEFDDDKSLWLLDVGSEMPDRWAPDSRDMVLQSVGSVDLLIALYEFTDSPESLEQLRVLADAAKSLGTSVLASAGSTLAGTTKMTGSLVALDGSHFDEPTSELWNALRTDNIASVVGLGFPRILLRQPYGKRSDPIDSFEFEELESSPQHESFAWGNPAIALAAMSLTQQLQIEDFPMITFDDGSGQAIKPPSEVYLADSASQKLLDNGLIPLLSQRGHTDIRTTRLQSIADPPTGI